MKVLNVQKVRLGLSRLARLAYGAFYEPERLSLKWGDEPLVVVNMA